jgi:hypothetical protein
MKLQVKTDFAKAAKLIRQLGDDQVKKATAKALTDSAFEARRVVHQQMDQNFDRVTPYIKRSILVKPATQQRLEAVVRAEYLGGKGVDPQKILRAEILGGPRRDKRSEVLLRKVGILPPGLQIVPGEEAPLDRYGNIRGSFLVQLLSYFQAFPEQGYRANMTDRRKAKLRNQQLTESGFKITVGKRYFISYGRLRSGKTSHLPAGIFSAEGMHDIVIKPILMFVRAPVYRSRLDFYQRPAVAALDKFNPRLRYHLRLAIEGRA